MPGVKKWRVKFNFPQPSVLTFGFKLNPSSGQERGGIGDGFAEVVTNLLEWETAAGFTICGRRDGRVAEGDGLLNRYRAKSPIGGSNPPLSAIFYKGILTVTHKGTHKLQSR